MRHRAPIVAAVVALSCCGHSASAASRPDVLLILADQWNPRYLSWADPQVITPNLDGIARDGMIFDACYTTSPICVPARISILTGLYPHNHGHAVWGNPNDYHLPPAAAPMFRDIRGAGYVTAQIGKLHWFGGASWRSEFDDIDEYHRAMGLDAAISVSGPPDSAAGRDPYSRHLAEIGILEKLSRDLRGRYLGWEYEPRPSVAAPEDYHDVFVAGLAVDFIRRQPRDKPFCLVASFHSPHPPLDAPGKFAGMFDPEKIVLPANVPERFERGDPAGKRTIDRAELCRMVANYLGKIALVDECIGRLVAAMKDRGAWDDALVIVTADHGEMMGAHGLLSKGRFWEESARVPLVIRWPGRVKAGRTAALAQLFDVYPTIVAAIGGDVTPGRLARSLLPVAKGEADSVRPAVISEVGNHGSLGLMVRRGGFKWWLERDEEFLFDVGSDPMELRNLAGSPAHLETRNRMRMEMIAAIRSTQVNFAEGSKSKVKRMREAASEGERRRE